MTGFDVCSIFFFATLLSLSCAAPAPEPKADPAPAPAPGPKPDPTLIATAPIVYQAAAAVPVAHSYSTVSQFTSHHVPIAKAAPLYASPYVAAASAPAAVYTYPAYHPAPAVVGSIRSRPVKGPIFRLSVQLPLRLGVGHPHFSIKVPLNIKLRPPHKDPSHGSSSVFSRLDEANPSHYGQDNVLSRVNESHEQFQQNSHEQLQKDSHEQFRDGQIQDNPFSRLDAAHQHFWDQQQLYAPSLEDNRPRLELPLAGNGPMMIPGMY